MRQAGAKSPYSYIKKIIVASGFNCELSNCCAKIITQVFLEIDNASHLEINDDNLLTIITGYSVSEKINSYRIRIFTSPHFCIYFNAISR